MRALATILAACAITGCSTAPNGRDVEPLADARRVTAVDMGLSSSARRLDNLSHRISSLPGELLRIGKFTKHANLVEAPVRRVAALSGTAMAIARRDLSRQPHLPEVLKAPDTYARDLADDLTTTIELFGGGHHPLGEIDDRRHRTSPKDDHPEASWWQRIRRRLRL